MNVCKPLFFLLFETRSGAEADMHALTFADGKCQFLVIASTKYLEASVGQLVVEVQDLDPDSSLLMKIV